MACDMCEAIDRILALPGDHGHGGNFVVCSSCCVRRYCPKCAQLTADRCRMKTLNRSLTRRKKCGWRRSFACAICERRFKAKKDLISHLHIHYNIKPCECETCGRSFRKIGNLRRHQRRLHERLTTNCPFCGEVCLSRDELMKHFKEGHLNNYAHKCPWCSEGFHYPEQLASHEYYCKLACSLCAEVSEMH